MPVVCLFLVAPFLRFQVSVWRDRLGAFALLLAAGLNAYDVFSESTAFQIAAEPTRKELANFPSETVINWGAAFPFEVVYPVLGASSSAMSYRIYSLGALSHAPFTNTFVDKKLGRGMIDLLVKERGVPIIAYKAHFVLLEAYCRERLHGQLKELSAKQYGTIEVSQRRCEVKP